MTDWQLRFWAARAVGPTVMKAVRVIDLTCADQIQHQNQIDRFLKVSRIALLHVQTYRQSHVDSNDGGRSAPEQNVR